MAIYERSPSRNETKSNSEKIQEVKTLNKASMDKVSHELKSMVASELLNVADSLNSESQSLVDKLVLQAANRIEANLQKTINKRFDELAEALANQADRAISN